MPIQVVTKEVRYIHELSLTLKHYMSISSPSVPGLTVSLTRVLPPGLTRESPCTYCIRAIPKFMFNLILKWTSVSEDYSAYNSTMFKGKKFKLLP